MTIEFPQEIIDEIVDHVADDKPKRTTTLKSCSLVSSQWLHRSQKHLFRKMRFTNITFAKWCEEVRSGDGGPVLHVVVLHYNANFNEVGQLTTYHLQLSSFANLQRLHLRATPIYAFTNEDLSMCFKQMGRSVRSVSLRACKMTVNDLVSFVRHFIKLERLSLIDPIVYNSAFDDSVESPDLNGILELRYMFVGRDTWDFIHQLSLLPLAFNAVVLEGIHLSLLTPINGLLATCRETLIKIDIRDHFVRNIDLTDCDVLQEMVLNAEIINHLPAIIKTVTSPQLKEIRFILSDPSLEKHYDCLDEWELIDVEICALVDRIRPVCRDNWRLSLKFVVASPADAGVVERSAENLLSASNDHGHITLLTERTGLP